MTGVVCLSAVSDVAVSMMLDCHGQGGGSSEFWGSVHRNPGRNSCDRTRAQSAPRLALLDSHTCEPVNQGDLNMFKIIGATVVYSLALFGLVKYLEATTYESK